MKNAIQRNNLALTLKTARKQLFPRGRVLLSSVVALVVSLAWLPAARAQCREGCSPEGYDAFLGNDALHRSQPLLERAAFDRNPGIFAEAQA